MQQIRVHGGLYLEMRGQMNLACKPLVLTIVLLIRSAMSVRIINNNNLLSGETMRIGLSSFIYKSRYSNLQIMHIYLHSLYRGFPDKTGLLFDVPGPTQAHTLNPASRPVPTLASEQKPRTSLITCVSCRSAIGHVELKCLNVKGIFKPSNPPVDT